MKSLRKIRSIAVLAVAAGAATFALVPSAHASAPTVARFGGADRYQTARVLAEKAFPNGAATVVLARAEDFANGAKGFADALSGNYLAGYLGAPILLTDGSSVPAGTAQALQDLKTKSVVVLGGTSAVAPSVVSQLQSTASTNGAGGDLTVSRIAGADRYQTAAMANGLIPASFVKVINGAPTALIARGDDFPDALAGGPLANASHLPLILTTPGSLDPWAALTLQTLHITSAIILGGTAAVSTATEQAIQALGITTTRLAGADRQQTAVDIANFAISNLGFSTSTLDIARGDAYPDALSGGPEAGAAGPAPILLSTSPTALGPEVTAFVQNAATTLTEVDLLGLQSALSDSVLADLEGLLGGTTTTTSSTSSTSTTLGSGLPGLGVPGLGTLLGELTSSQQLALEPTLASLPSTALSLIGGVVQAVPGGQLGGVGTLLEEPTSLLGPLATLAPSLPTGGLTSLGGLLDAVPAGQLLPIGSLLSGMPSGAAGPLGSLLTGLPTGQLGSLGSLLSAANTSQLPIIGQVLTQITGGGLGGLLGGLLGQLSGLPGVSVLSSLTSGNAGLLNTLLSTLSTAQVTQLGGVLSGIGAPGATSLGTLLGQLPSGGASKLGAVLSAVPSGQSSVLGPILAGLSTPGSTAVTSLVTGVQPSQLAAAGQILKALP